MIGWLGLCLVGSGYDRLARGYAWLAWDMIGWLGLCLVGSGYDRLRGNMLGWLEI